MIYSPGSINYEEKIKMKKKYIWPVLILVILLAGLFIMQIGAQGVAMNKQQPLTQKSIYDFILNDIDGHEVKLDRYRGQVILIVNVASKCGFTPQYAGLQKIYLKYKDQGFVVLGFPANNFLSQEPGSNEEIKNFCSTRYNVTFLMFAKISVKGEDKHPLYRFLTEEVTDPEFAGEITWNFNKFLVDRSGKIIARYGSREKPEDESLTGAIEKALSSAP
jgi:glutathione peroxidase-family protein